MSLDTKYPSPLKLKRNELKTLQFLGNTPFIAKHFLELSSAARDYSIRISVPKKLKSTSFNFEAPLELIIEGMKRQVIIGVNLQDAGDKEREAKYDIVSYSLSICEKRNNPSFQFLRKFHFDYAIPENKAIQPTPIFHLQYGGKLSPYLIGLGLKDEGGSWLSVPRLNHHPLTLALLLDIIFCEFRSELTHRIVERNEWRRLIKENEELVVKPYYENINRFVQSGTYNSKFLIRDYCYGK